MRVPLGRVGQEVLHDSLLGEARAGALEKTRSFRSRIASMLMLASLIYGVSAGLSAPQVRKTDSKGTQLPPGVVAVTGPKTALPPVQLVMGFGILFKVDVRLCILFAPLFLFGFAC